MSCEYNTTVSNTVRAKDDNKILPFIPIFFVLQQLLAEGSNVIIEKERSPTIANVEEQDR